MFYMGQCDEGLVSTVVIGMYEDGEIMTHCTRNTMANLTYMLEVARRDILEY